MYCPPEVVPGEDLGWQGGYRVKGLTLAPEPSIPSTDAPHCLKPSKTRYNTYPVPQIRKARKKRPKRSNKNFICTSLELHTTQGRLLRPGASLPTSMASPDMLQLNDNYSRYGKEHSGHRSSKDADSVRQLLTHKQNPKHDRVLLEETSMLEALPPEGRQVGASARLENMIANSNACENPIRQGKRQSRRPHVFEWSHGDKNKPVSLILSVASIVCLSFILRVCSSAKGCGGLVGGGETRAAVAAWYTEAQ